MLLAAGCAWQQENIVPTAPPQPDGTLGVEIDSMRTLAGAEYFTEFVYPNTRDSVQYIIVNGKIVWQATPFWIDSAAPYHFDGRTNSVSMVWPSISKMDTESIVDTGDEILSPTFGDTIVRLNGVTIRYPITSFIYFNQILLDDGVDTMTFAADTSGTYRVADTTLMKFHGPWLRITLNTFTNFFGGPLKTLHSTNIEAYRSIQYPMK